jgi:hypothetical protein
MNKYFTVFPAITFGSELDVSGVLSELEYCVVHPKRNKDNDRKIAIKNLFILNTSTNISYYLSEENI